MIEPNVGLFVDLSPLQGPFFERGIPRYVAELSRALLTASANIVGFGLAPELPLPHEVFNDLVEHPLCGLTTPERMAKLRDERKFAVLLTSPFEGFPLEQVWRPELVCGPESVAAIVYDTIPLRYPHMYQATVERIRFYEARVRVLRTADHFFAISDTAKAELVEDVGVDPAKVTVIGTGVSDQFVPPDDPSRARLIGQRLVSSFAGRSVLEEATRPYILCIGGWTATKNIDRLLEAWAIFVGKHDVAVDLALVCRVPDDLGNEWQLKLTRLGIEDSVVVTGKVSDEDLLALYQGARLFISPSLHEGFGLPLAEAIRCGVLAIGSNVGPIAEQLAEPQSQFDPTNVVEMAEVLERFAGVDLKSDVSTIQRLTNSKHEWSLVAAVLLSTDGMFVR
jgi:glycosyltransferase involved in cell wall biosynthesis